ncbi:MAG: 5-formyltetrahydrofolate cyclo-ligase [Betaproteobacteria bacterium]|nr:5-formyltetrahydrofolate cyclo-ligase [Betaproteobacteria bacterium]
MSTSNMKQDIRKNILNLRKQLSEGTRAAHSAAITERLLQLPEYQHADAVLGYMNFGAEYASELWVARVLAEGKRLALPKVNHHTDCLDLYWVDDLENQLTEGLWGIREPIVERCERLTVTYGVEFVLLPGVAFTRDGARLGYGKGYYDKLLARMVHCPALVAAAYYMQLVENIPQEATDRKVEWLVTENETIDCAA